MRPLKKLVEVWREKETNRVSNSKYRLGQTVKYANEYHKIAEIHKKLDGYTYTLKCLGRDMYKCGVPEIHIQKIPTLTDFQ